MTFNYLMNEMTMPASIGPRLTGQSGTSGCNRQKLLTIKLFRRERTFFW